MSLVLLLIVGYLLGSLNFSIIFTKIFANTDVRNHGSGNAGFTNTLRTAGKKVAILVFICDALKAIAAILVAIIFSLIWITGLFVRGMFLVMFLLTGYVSRGSLVGAVTTAVATAVMYVFNINNTDAVQLVLMIILAILAFYMHRANIKRLLNGTESSFKKKK